MRSSLALASEQDPQLLLCTLLRILCQVSHKHRVVLIKQFARADYAAIALVDEDDKTQLRLRAAGRHDRILHYDTLINDSEGGGHDICPTLYLTHVMRTGKVRFQS